MSTSTALAPTKPKRRLWTTEEKQRLSALWPKGLPACCKALRRSVAAVRVQAIHLGLTGRSDETLLGLSRETGYSISRLKIAAQWLNITFARWKGSGKATLHMVTMEQRDQIVAFLRDLPDGAPLLAPTGRRTPAHLWGVGGKPPACIECGTTERKHCGGGRCLSCYQRRWKTWGVDGRPAACLGCGTTTIRHYAAGLCSTCGKRR